MKIKQQVTCPYCSVTSLYADLDAEMYYSNPQVITCDSEQGGCDRFFVVAITLRPYIKTFEIVDLGGAKLGSIENVLSMIPPDKTLAQWEEEG